MMNSSPPRDCFENLRTLYQETWGEIHRLRDLEWKLAYYFLSLSGALIALLTTEVVRGLLSTRIRVMLTTLQALCALFAIIYLNQTHFYLTRQRNIRRRIEEVMGFFDDGVFATNSMLPARWKGKVITHGFQWPDLIFPLTLIVLVVQGFTVFIVWKL